MTVFSESDADAWYRRNKDKMGKGPDPVLRAIKTNELLSGHENVLEIGCANGWRLNRLQNDYNAECWGVELSPLAIADIPPGIRINQPMTDGMFDLVIAGFCLYLLSPDKLFAFVAATNEWLAEGGHLVVYDFCPDHPHSVVYKHNTDLRSYKMDHSKLWLAHPGYQMVASYSQGESPAERTHVSILEKNMFNAFPLERLEGK